MTDSVTGEMYEWMYVLVLLPWEVMRRILCRLLRREMPSVSFHEFGYAAAVFFFFLLRLVSMFPNNKMQCKPFFLPFF